MFGKKTIVVPSTEKSATTYFKLLEVLTTKELRDFLRVKMSESVSLLPYYAEKGTLKQEQILKAIGEINIYKYLLGDAVSEIESACAEIERENQVNDIINTDGEEEES